VIGLYARPEHQPIVPVAAVPAASVRRTLARPGTPIEGELRRQTEGRFGRDFAGVRIHSGTEAVASAHELGAAAYTAGSSIVFGHQRYAPHTPAGRRLLVHELAHVVQQRDAPRILPEIGSAQDSSERVADRIARGSGERPSIASAVPAVQRQPAGAPGPAAPTGLPDKPAGDRATDEEIEAKLTEFLTRVLRTQGGQELRDSPVIGQALHALAGSDSRAALSIESFLANKSHPGSPSKYAKQARRHLPMAIPRAQLAQLDRIPAAPSVSGAPTSVGDAIGHVIVDQTIAPLIKRLTNSPDLQKKLIEAARDAVASGVAGMASAAISATNLDPKAQTALSAAIEQAIKQKASSKPPPTTDDTNLRQPPPSAAPPSPPVPGETNLKTPPAPIPDAPGVKKPDAAPAPAPASVEQVIQGLDENALIPPSARGTPLADSLSDAHDFARALADKLQAAQKTKTHAVTMTISHAYRQVDDVHAVLDEVERITRLIARALPDGASNVGQVTIIVADTHILRVIHLN
jgi:hypothetical protein